MVLAAGAAAVSDHTRKWADGRWPLGISSKIAKCSWAAGERPASNRPASTPQKPVHGQPPPTHFEPWMRHGPNTVIAKHSRHIIRRSFLPRPGLPSPASCLFDVRNVHALRVWSNEPRSERNRWERWLGCHGHCSRGWWQLGHSQPGRWRGAGSGRSRGSLEHQRQCTFRRRDRYRGAGDERQRSRLPIGLPGAERDLFSLRSSAGGQHGRLRGPTRLRPARRNLAASLSQGMRRGLSTAQLLLSRRIPGGLLRPAQVGLPALTVKPSVTVRLSAQEPPPPQPGRRRDRLPAPARRQRTAYRRTPAALSWAIGNFREPLNHDTNQPWPSICHLPSS